MLQKRPREKSRECSQQLKYQDAGKEIVISGANCLAVCSAFSSQPMATTGAAAFSSYTERKSYSRCEGR